MAGAISTARRVAMIDQQEVVDLVWKLRRRKRGGRPWSPSTVADLGRSPGAQAEHRVSRIRHREAGRRVDHDGLEAKTRAEDAL